MIFTLFLSYSKNKTESPCTNSRYTQCLKSFSYHLTAVYRFLSDCAGLIDMQSPIQSVCLTVKLNHMSLKLAVDRQ